MKKKLALNMPFERHSDYLHYVPEVYQHCKLDNFDFAENNKIPTILKKFLDKPTNGLYIFGDYGVGKTHILVGLYRIILAREQNVLDVLFISLEKIMKDLIIKIETKQPSTNYIDYICNVKWLFLDDLTAIPLKDYTIDIIRKIINTRYEKNLILCTTANGTISELAEKGLQFHAASRLTGMCNLVEIVGRDRRLSNGVDRRT